MEAIPGLICGRVSFESQFRLVSSESEGKIEKNEVVELRRHGPPRPTHGDELHQFPSGRFHSAPASAFGQTLRLNKGSGWLHAAAGSVLNSTGFCLNFNRLWSSFISLTFSRQTFVLLPHLILEECVVF